MLAKTIYHKIIESPVGKLQLLASDNALLAVLPQNHFYKETADLQESANYSVLLKAEKQLGEYFSGNRKKFDVPLNMRGTVFQIKAWKELQKIPYGKTISYGQQAEGMGDKKKARAAGVANSRNPLIIIVPCHRVIGASGALTGFGGGLPMKKYLLDLEKRY